MQVFYGLYFPVSGQKLQFCLYTGICGSEKTHILAYFAQCSIQFKYLIKTQPKIFVMSPNLLMKSKELKKKKKKKNRNWFWFMNIANCFTGQVIKSLDLPALAVRVNEYSLNVIFKINIGVINLNISKRYKRHGTLFESTVGKSMKYAF